jgi:uncharacterized membrane protein (UPF0127 family)
LKKRILITPSGYALIVDVARTEKERAEGLMGRVRLLPYQGMLFVHPRADVHRYWMHGVLIPLDILWLDDELSVLDVVAGAVPGSTVPLGTVLRSRFGLEIPAGMAARYSLRVGDQLKAC